MNPSDIDQSIIAQETLRLTQEIERTLSNDNQAFQYVVVIDYDLSLGLWTVQAGPSQFKATYQGNAAIAIGQTVHYYKAQDQNYGYIKTMPRA